LAKNHYLWPIASGDLRPANSHMNDLEVDLLRPLIAMLVELGPTLLIYTNVRDSEPDALSSATSGFQMQDINIYCFKLLSVGVTCSINSSLTQHGVLLER
jgi:hypothetical protein